VKIAVVIPALDEEGSVAAAVASARAQDVEVWVVDGESRDATARRAQDAGARLLEAPPGRARQLEAGARAAGGEVLLFLHADTRLPPGWERSVESACNDPAVAGGCFRLRFEGSGAALRIVEWGAWLRVALFGLPYGDQALFVRRQVLDAVGGVPQAPIMEDLDLAREIKRHGRLVQLPLAVETSGRRYQGRVFRQMLRNWAALLGWRLGLDRGRLARWYAG
jgi:rSAM/selenodomain-associated transferase 2